MKNLKDNMQNMSNDETAFLNNSYDKILTSNNIDDLLKNLNEQYTKKNDLIFKKNINQARIIILLGCYGFSAENIIDLNIGNLNLKEKDINFNNNHFFIRPPLDNFLNDFISMNKIDINEKKCPLFLNKSKRLSLYDIQLTLDWAKIYSNIHKYISIKALNESNYYEDSLTNIKKDDFSNSKIKELEIFVNEININQESTKELLENHITKCDIKLEKVEEIEKTIEDSKKDSKSFPSIKNNDNDLENQLKKELMLFIEYQTHLNKKMENNLEKYSEQINNLKKDKNNLIKQNELFKKTIKLQNSKIEKLKELVDKLESNLLENDDYFNNTKLNKQSTIIIQTWIEDNIIITNNSSDVVKNTQIIPDIKRSLSKNKLLINDEKLNELINEEFKKYNNKRIKEHIKVINGITYYIGFKLNHSKNVKKLDYKKIIDSWIKQNVKVTDNYDDNLFYSDIYENVVKVLKEHNKKYKREDNIKKQIEESMAKIHNEHKFNIITHYRLINNDKIEYIGFKFS